MECDEEFFVFHNLLFPGGAIDFLQLVEARFLEFKSAPLDVMKVRSPADRRLSSHCTSVDAIDDPAQNADVLAESWPHELSILIFSEPVHMENPGSSG